MEYAYEGTSIFDVRVYQKSGKPKNYAESDCLKLYGTEKRRLVCVCLVAIEDSAVLFR